MGIHPRNTSKPPIQTTNPNHQSKFTFAKQYLLFSLVGFTGNLSLLEIETNQIDLLARKVCTARVVQALETWTGSVPNASCWGWPGPQILGFLGGWASLLLVLAWFKKEAKKGTPPFQFLFQTHLLSLVGGSWDFNGPSSPQ